MIKPTEESNLEQITQISFQMIQDKENMDSIELEPNFKFEPEEI